MKVKNLVCPQCGKNFQIPLNKGARRRQYCDDRECRKARKKAENNRYRYESESGLTEEQRQANEILRAQRSAEARRGQKRTEEQRARISAAAKKTYTEGRKPAGGTHDTPEAKERQRQIALKQHAEGKISLEGLAKGRSRTYEERSDAWTDEKRAAQAERTLQAYQEGRMKAYGRHRGRWAIYDGPKGVINMRSRSEVIFARDLDAQGIDWSYEPQRFDLGWSTYCPDFYLPVFDRWVEIKGHQTDLARRKIDDFSGSRSFSIVLAQDLQRLEKMNN